MKNQLRIRRWWPAGVAGCATVLSLGVAYGQDATWHSIAKIQNFVQGGPGVVTLADEEFEDAAQAPFVFEAFLEAEGPNLVSNVILDRPGGADIALEGIDDGQEYEYLEGFPLFTELNAKFPVGAYTTGFNTVNDGSRSIKLQLPADDYAGVPVFTVHDQAQDIDADSSFTFRWEPLGNAGADDPVFLILEDENGELYESPDLGEPGSLDGTSTSHTVPRGTLAPGNRYLARLSVFKFADSDDSYAEAVSAYGKRTTMLIQTRGATDTIPPGLIKTVPFPFDVDVQRNAVITFEFDEPMNSSGDPGDAVAWTGLPDAGLFSYRWSPDDRALSCHYPGGLPASATIEWSLNAPGSTGTLRDRAGNALPEQSGQFETSGEPVPAVPDVRTFEIGKARSYLQDGPTPTDLSTHLAGFFVDLNAPGTVSSVDLGIPGRGLVGNLGQWEFDRIGVEGEAEFAEGSDLDAVFPNGTYEVRMHTFNNGEQRVSLDLEGDAYPPPPTVLDFAAAQAIDSGQPFTLRWEPMEGGTSRDYIELYLEGEEACYFETPPAGEEGVLDGTATSVTIPAHTLPPGRTVEGELVFVRVTDEDSTSYPGVTGRAAYFSITEFTVRTTGDPIAPSLEIRHGGGQATITVTGEVGFEYSVKVSDDLQNWTPMFSFWLFDDCDGYRSSFELIEQVDGVSSRFYQVEQRLPEGP